MRELRAFLKEFSHSTALALTLKMPSHCLTSHWIYSSFTLAQRGQGALPEYYPWSWLSALAALPYLPLHRQHSHPWPHPARRDHKPRSGDPHVLPAGPGAAMLTPQKHSHHLLPRPSLLGHHYYFFLQRAAEHIRSRSMLDCQTVEENGYCVAAGLSEGLMASHVLPCGLVSCIIPPVANATCLFTVWGIFPNCFQIKTNLHNCN